MSFLSTHAQPAAQPPTQLEASVLIPTRERAGKLATCLKALAGQSLGMDRFEVLVGLDGPEPESAEVVKRAGANMRAVPGPRRGLLAVREELIGEARGRVMISINDDVEVCPEFVAVHVQSHREAQARSQTSEPSGENALRPGVGGAAIVVGDSPWKVHAGDTLFDRLVRETSMLFFYDQMRGPAAADRWHDWGFRHCFGLNFSAPLALIREVGGFRGFPFVYGYEDIELGYRLAERFGAPVLFRPAARAVHDHRYAPRDVLWREYQLGRAAWVFAEASPAFARAVFRRDIRSREELSYTREFLAREEGTAARLRESFLRIGELPAEAVGPEPEGALQLRLIYEQHLMLKRWMWRAGLADAQDGVKNEARYPQLNTAASNVQAARP